MRKLDEMQESQWNRVHADGLENRVTHQGNYLKWRREMHYVQPCVDNKRGTVKMFSRASRLRLLKAFAKMDWKANAPCIFVTLTFPDGTGIPQNALMNKYRWRFWQYLERWSGEKRCGIWRCEWMQRQSGIRIGTYMPHLHMLVFGEEFIPWQEVKWWWMNVLGQRQVSVDVQAVENIAHATSYVAKYIGKMPAGTLDNAAYLNTVPPGRCWGFFHKSGIVLHDEHTALFRETDEVASARCWACPGKVELLDGSNGSFTILGEAAGVLASILFGQGLDGELHSV